MIGVLLLGIAIGAYGAWGLTVLWFAAKREDGDGGTWDVPDFVPDDLVGDSYLER